MNELDDKGLDHLLQRWSQSSAANESELISLEYRIKQEMLTERDLSERVQIARSRDVVRYLKGFIGIAAAILIAVVGWRFLRPADWGSDFSPAASAPSYRAQLLSAYKEVFGTDLSWFVEQSSRTEIGLRSSGSKLSDAPHDFVAVQLLLFARPASGRDWREIQTINVVARREEVVEVVALADHHAALTLWAYPLDNKMISIDLSYQPSQFTKQTAVPDDIAIESSTVQSFGDVTPIYSFERDGTEYRLYQSAILLPEKGVG